MVIGIGAGNVRSVLVTVNRPVTRSTGSPPLAWRARTSSEVDIVNAKCHARRGRPCPASLAICLPSAVTVPVPHTVHAPATRSKYHRSAEAPGGAFAKFGKAMGSGRDGAAPPGLIA